MRGDRYPWMGPQRRFPRQWFGLKNVENDFMQSAVLKAGQKIRFNLEVAPSGIDQRGCWQTTIPCQAPQ